MCNRVLILPMTEILDKARWTFFSVWPPSPWKIKNNPCSTEFPVFQFLVFSVATSENTLSQSSLPPASWEFFHVGKTALSLLFSSTATALSASSHMPDAQSPWSIWALVGLAPACPYLSCNGIHETGHRPRDAASHCSLGLRGRITSPPAGNALANAAERAVVFSHKAPLLAQFNLVTTRIQFFSVKLLSTLSASSLYKCLELSLPRCRTVHCPFLNFSLFSRQYQYPWTAAQPSDIISQSSQFCIICKLSEGFLCPNIQAIRSVLDQTVLDPLLISSLWH